MDKQIKPEAEPMRHALWPNPFDGFNAPAMRAATWPIEIWLQWQADMLETAATATAEWVTRRREGTKSALDALHRLSNCNDAANAAEIQREWARGAATRMEADIRWLTDTAAVWQRASAKAVGRELEVSRAS